MVIALILSLLILSANGALEHQMGIALSIAVTLVSVIGFIDDVMGVRATVRLMVHIVAAFIIVFAVAAISEESLSSWGLHGRSTAIVLSMLFIVWTTNLFNFMDGIDGLAASEAVAVCAAGAVLNWYHDGSYALTVTLFSVAAAALGFLRWNLPKATIFMGDVGSGFLGVTIAALALVICKSGALPIEVWGILGGVFLADSTTALVRRVLNGERWFAPHRSHAYQHLSLRWKSHSKVTALVVLINVGWLIPWAAVAAATPAYAKYCLTIALTPLFIAVFLIGSGRPET